MLGPANEFNELDTLLVLGQFGDGINDTVFPTQIEIVDELILVTPDGDIDANGLKYENHYDMNYVTSTVRLVYSRMWDVSKFSEGTHYPTWPLPSGTYPNTCEYTFPNTTHVVRMAFSGGVTLDGVTSILPTTEGIFSVFVKSSMEEVHYIGLADLGDVISSPAGTAYISDGDNFLDICLDLSSTPDVASEDLLIRLNCNENDGSVLYPPKGAPHGCKPQEITMTSENTYGYFDKYWEDCSLSLQYFIWLGLLIIS